MNNPNHNHSTTSQPNDQDPIDKESQDKVQVDQIRAFLKRSANEVRQADPTISDSELHEIISDLKSHIQSRIGEVLLKKGSISNRDIEVILQELGANHTETKPESYADINLPVFETTKTSEPQHHEPQQVNQHVKASSTSTTFPTQRSLWSKLYHGFTFLCTQIVTVLLMIIFLLYFLYASYIGYTAIRSFIVDQQYFTSEINALTVNIALITVLYSLIGSINYIVRARNGIKTLIIPKLLFVLLLLLGVMQIGFASISYAIDYGYWFNSSYLLSVVITWISLVAYGRVLLGVDVKELSLLEELDTVQKKPVTTK